MISGSDAKLLLDLARNTVRGAAGGERFPAPAAEGVFALHLGAFVTLKSNGRLRGCIGSFRGTGALGETIRDMAVQAAVGDPRFSPVRPSEVDGLTIEISLLSPMTASAAGDVIPGVHGVYVKRGNRAGTLLPQVASEEGWDRETFLSHACLKAGIPADSWKHDGTEIFVYTAQVIRETEERKK